MEEEGGAKLSERCRSPAEVILFSSMRCRTFCAHHLSFFARLPSAIAESEFGTDRTVAAAAAVVVSTFSMYRPAIAPLSPGSRGFVVIFFLWNHHRCVLRFSNRSGKANFHILIKGRIFILNLCWRSSLQRIKEGD